MKQLTIFCSIDLEERVVAVLDHAGVDGFVELGKAVARRFATPGAVPRTIDWEARVVHVPAAEEEVVRRVVEPLREYAGGCEIAPCLRIVVSAVDEVH